MVRLTDAGALDAAADFGYGDAVDYYFDYAVD